KRQAGVGEPVDPGDGAERVARGEDDAVDPVAEQLVRDERRRLLVVDAVRDLDDVDVRAVDGELRGQRAEDLADLVPVEAVGRGRSGRGEVVDDVGPGVRVEPDFAARAGPGHLGGTD